MRHFCLALVATVALVFYLPIAYGQLLNSTAVTISGGTELIPASDTVQSGYGHTNYRIYMPSQRLSTATDTLPGGETPASIDCVYSLTPTVPGCPIAGTTVLPSGGNGTIALVDAYDNPTAEADLATFSSQFGLPACTTANGCFSVIYAAGQQPAFDAGWAGEEDLDIEWAHAMAPNASIVLVEAASSSSDDLYQAEAVASETVYGSGGGEVSNSWGGSEFAQETSVDSVFTQYGGIVYFASAGDSGAPAQYPASSPNVIAAGGTTLVRNSSGLLTGETGWSDNGTSGGGGGPSQYEPRPSFQNVIQSRVGTQRGTPDIAFDANPQSGVDVYSPAACDGWCIIGGTSLSSPALAGLINVAHQNDATPPSTLAVQQIIYSDYTPSSYLSYWHDITVGNNGYPCTTGYDFVTGLGSPLGYQGK